MIPPDGEPVSLSYFKDIVNSSSIFIVAEENEKIIGYSSADILPGKLAMWWLLSVDPKKQNKGIGKKLFSKVEEECKKKGVKYLIGYAPQFNKKTLAFHKKNGFSMGEKMVEILKVLD